LSPLGHFSQGVKGTRTLRLARFGGAAVRHDVERARRNVELTRRTRRFGVEKHRVGDDERIHRN